MRGVDAPAKGCAQRRPPQDGTAGCQCTSTKAEHNDIPRSRGEVGRRPTSEAGLHAPPPVSPVRGLLRPAPIGARWGYTPPSVGATPASPTNDEGPHPPLTWQSPAPLTLSGTAQNRLPPYHKIQSSKVPKSTASKVSNTDAYNAILDVNFSRLSPLALALQCLENSTADLAFFNFSTLTNSPTHVQCSKVSNTCTMFQGLQNIYNVHVFQASKVSYTCTMFQCSKVPCFKCGFQIQCSVYTKM